METLLYDVFTISTIYFETLKEESEYDRRAAPRADTGSARDPSAGYAPTPARAQGPCGLGALLRCRPDYQRLATVFDAATRDAGATGVVALLASPTAEREVPYFVQCARLLHMRFGIEQFDVVLVRWENVLEQQHQPEHQRQAVFHRIVQATRRLLTVHAWIPSRLHAVDVVIDDVPEAVISAPRDFALADEAVRLAVRSGSPQAVPETLRQDLQWTIDFYGRKASLSRLGPRQPLIDLAIRREIGRALSIGTLWCGQKLPRWPICLTSELTRRLVKCYHFEIANLNLGVCNRQPVPTHAAQGGVCLDQPHTIMTCLAH